MKKLLFIFAATMLLSCSSDSDDSITPATTPPIVTNSNYVLAEGVKYPLKHAYIERISSGSYTYFDIKLTDGELYYDSTTNHVNGQSTDLTFVMKFRVEYRPAVLDPLNDYTYPFADFQYPRINSFSFEKFNTARFTEQDAWQVDAPTTLKIEMLGSNQYDINFSSRMKVPMKATLTQYKGLVEKHY